MLAAHTKGKRSNFFEITVLGKEEMNGIIGHLFLRFSFFKEMTGEDIRNSPVWPLMILIRIKASSWFYIASRLIDTEA